MDYWNISLPQTASDGLLASISGGQMTESGRVLPHVLLQTGRSVGIFQTGGEVDRLGVELSFD
jgi:hypothetical protein